MSWSAVVFLKKISEFGLFSSGVSPKNFRVPPVLQWCFFRIFRSSACSPVVFLPNFSEFRPFSCGVSSGFLRTLNYFLWLPLLPSSVDSPEKKVQPLLNFCSLALFLSLSPSCPGPGPDPHPGPAWPCSFGLCTEA